MKFRHIQVDPMTPTIGGMISGVDLNTTRSEDVYEEIKQALWQYGVVFFRKQALKPEAYIRLGANFGEMEQHEFFPHIAGHPQIQLISNEGNEAPETDRWHTDVTFRKKPNMVSILRITDLPPSGGDTMWMHAGAAYDALNPGMQQMLEGLQADHDLPWHFRRINASERLAKRASAKSGMMVTASAQECKMIENTPTVSHPAVITHPYTGRKILFVNSIWTKRLLGMHMDLSEAVLNMLFEWVKKPEFMVRFRWEKDSLAMWDNCATQHYAVFDYAPHYRAGQRMTCGSFVPTLNHGANAEAGGQASVMRQLLDTTRMQAASPREQQAVEAIFSALESVDLNAVANAAQRR
jgi:taurine dioxygenase